MIYTVTLNPSIDYIIELHQFIEGDINRTVKEDYVFGGKGINVSTMLQHLGMSSCALGFCAGFSGEALEKGVKEYGIQPDFVHVKDGFTRINVKMKTSKESEINGQGPCIKEQDLQAFFQKLDKLKEGDILVLSGNVPSSIPQSIYADIMKKVENLHIRIIVDATGDSLQNVLPYHPFLIKPNHVELAEMFQVEINSKEDIIYYAKKLHELGAVNVLISMAEKGAILISEDAKVYEACSPKGSVVNSVGAGDSMVAGFLYGYMQHKSYEEALRYGIACGSASAFCKGIAKKESVMLLLEQLGG